MRTATLALSLLFIMPSICSEVNACSMPASYRVPTSLQLVEQADAIVLAKIVDGGLSKFEPIRRVGGRLARLVPIATLKGNYTNQPIAFDYAMLELPSIGLRATSSDPRNLVDANPDVFDGGCNRSIFKKDMLIVAFLKKDGSHFVPFAPAFSRALEDVPSANSLWVKAVRMYVAVAAKQPRLRRAEMRRQRDFLQYELHDPDDRLLALELDRALQNPKR